MAALETAAVFAIAADGRSANLSPMRRQTIARAAISALLDGGKTPKSCGEKPAIEFFNAAREAARRKWAEIK